MAPTIEYSLKQTMSAVISKQIIDHPKMQRIIDIAKLLFIEWKETKNKQLTPPKILVIVEHFILLKIMEKYIKLYDLNQFTILEQKQHCDEMLDILLINQCWFMATTDNILCSILKNDNMINKQKFLNSISKIIIYSPQIQDKIGKYLINLMKMLRS